MVSMPADVKTNQAPWCKAVKLDKAESRDTITTASEAVHNKQCNVR